MHAPSTWRCSIQFSERYRRRDTRRDSRAERGSLLPLEMHACLPGCAVDHDDAEDGPSQCGHPFTGFHDVRGERETGGDPKENREKVSEMVEEPSKERVMVRPDKDIGSALSQSPLNVIGRQTTVGGVQPLQHVFGREPVNVMVANVGHWYLVRSGLNRE